MKKSKITTEDLAGMVQRGFDDVKDGMAKGFEAVDKRFEAVDKRFEAVDKRFEAVDKRFDDVNSRFNFVGSRLDVIETELLDIRKKMDNIVYRNEFEYLKERVEKLEALLVGTKKK